MFIVCALMRDPNQHPCAECCEDHCGEPGCHGVHACWPCFREYENTYFPHTTDDDPRCERHPK